MNNRVTYLTGAGASIHALPVINQMQARMQLFYDFLFHSTMELHDFHKTVEEYESILKDFKEVLDNSGKHATIDTYAKKLFLQGLGNSRKMYALKFFLAGYFIFEQVGINENKLMVKDESFRGGKRNIIYERFKGMISKRVDPRYDVFFATLLERNGADLKLPPNVNVLTWNYDYQFELAYSEFSESQNKLSNAQEKLNILTSSGLNPDWATKNSQIVKLNGCAGNFYESIPAQQVLSIRRELNEDRFEEAFKHLFKNYINIVSKGSTPFKYPNLNFAWEFVNNRRASETIEIVQSIMKRTDVVVVIGYSFPNFNREIDKKLFESFKGVGKKIYYQAPEKDVHGLISRLKGILPKEYVGEPIPHTELDQFFIPYEL